MKFGQILMAAAKPDDKPDLQAPPPRRRRRLLVPLLTILLGLLGMLAGLVAAMGPGEAIALLTGAPPAAEAPPAEEDGHQAAEGGHGAPAAPAHGAPGQQLAVMPFQEIIVNITATTATGRQTTRFLKLNVALVYDGHAAGSEHVEGRKLYLRDSFQDYLRQLSERDLQGSYGIAMVKTELLRRARAVADSEAPQDILISDLIVQ